MYESLYISTSRLQVNGTKTYEEEVRQTIFRNHSNLAQEIVWILFFPIKMNEFIYVFESQRKVNSKDEGLLKRPFNAQFSRSHSAFMFFVSKDLSSPSVFVFLRIYCISWKSIRVNFMMEMLSLSITVYERVLINDQKMKIEIFVVILLTKDLQYPYEHHTTHL